MDYIIRTNHNPAKDHYGSYYPSQWEPWKPLWILLSEPITGRQMLYWILLSSSECIYTSQHYHLHASTCLSTNLTIVLLLLRTNHTTVCNTCELYSVWINLTKPGPLCENYLNHLVISSRSCILLLQRFIPQAVVPNTYISGVGDQSAPGDPATLRSHCTVYTGHPKAVS